MKKNFLKSLTVLALICFSYIQGQTVVFKHHKVNRGETVTNIAKQHNVFVKDIYKYNPGAENGIKENSFLLIPNIIDNEIQNGPSISTIKTPTEKQVPNTNVDANIHIVQKSETLYSISKKYGVSIENLLQLNPSLKKDELQTGQQIVISNSKPAEIKNTTTNKQLDKDKKIQLKSITIKPKQTIYGLAVEYKTTVKTLYALNPNLEEEGLKIGQKIYVPASKVVKETLEVTSVNEPNPDTYKTITVLPKQTLYSLSRQYNISTEQLIELNPELKNGLIIGMILKVPAKENPNYTYVSNKKINLSNSSNFKNLEKTIDRHSLEKELVLLLPFNAHKIGNDPSSIQEKIKKDAFLNMTLDFYSGALIAIDSAKSLGLPLNVKIYDSKESKSSSSVPTLALNNSFRNTDVIIGPFFQNNITKTAEYIKNTNIALVSPLSTENSLNNSYQIQAMPSTSDLRIYLIEYLLSQKGNLVVIIDDKKTSTRKFLAKEYPFIKIVNSSNISEISNHLRKDIKNFVVSDTGSIQNALSTIDELIKISNIYNIQLATFDKNELYDSREISIDAITKLKLLYPSVIRDSENAESNYFAKIYKQKNNAYPNRFAIRGFDVTMDIILRMFQSGDFKENLTEYKTQYVDNKFIYYNSGNAVHNQGIYLLYHDDDLTIKNIQ